MFTIDARDLFPQFQAFHWTSVILDYSFSACTILSGLIGTSSLLFISDVRHPKLKITTFIIWVLSLFLSLGLALANAGIVIYLLVTNFGRLGFHFSFVFSLVYQGLFSIVCVIVLIVVVFLEIPLVYGTYKRNVAANKKNNQDGEKLMDSDDDEEEELNGNESYMAVSDDGRVKTSSSLSPSLATKQQQ
ncbi:hypothetical protein FDP41_006247 [Naegleria fowleri]|uniref:Uncharacterized protein n=1 Tax=Naegleria fowleri TaxID=5763 RepID=A0A6A5B990_NAEFO|nr:uncharacterized protein FDP41_006247 [Naegleria fowleri]KAF0974773.1 hypothetical protein FDP41_006247 [Naegleria fowleri]CAG4714115.1 unnamed protein product [Naegleria fowleri]